MDSFEQEPQIQIQLPENFEVPILHEKPKTTLDSLLQIKNEFDSKIEEAIVKNDAGKKRRYQRQSKLFEDAIKATKEGKKFNYSELVVPPGFAQIPLDQNGRPISMEHSAPKSSSAAATSQRTSQIIPTPAARNKPSQPAPTPKPAPAPAPVESYDNLGDDETGDDLLDQLEREAENDDEDLEMDAEDEEFERQMKQAANVIPNIDKLVPKAKGGAPDYLSDQLNSLVIPEGRTIAPKGSQGSIASANPRANQVQAPRAQPQPQQPPPQRSPQKPATINPSNAGKQSKELEIILERQNLFKQAAVKAKADGNLNLALTYLKLAKGFDSMIQGAQNGLPLDMTNLPVPPQMQEALRKKQATVASRVTASVSNTSSNHLDTPEIINEQLSGDRQAIYKQLMTILKQQVEIATDNYKHYTNMGDIGNANKFNKIARESIQDLEALINANKLGEPVPLYHYEKRTYEKIDCNSDLTDNDLELTIVRAINLPIPKDLKQENMHTFVKFDFPYPPEQEQTDKTKTQNANCNPEYNQKFKLQIQRKQQKFIRLMNRKELKLELFLYRGMLRSDRLLGNCNIKLQSLENSSTIHEAFDVLEGRRQTGGKIEVMIRIREPLLHKDVKLEEQKWLIIDKFERNSSSVL